LLSRYYEPNICRFINADSYITNYKGIISNNLFSYCFNNPVIYKDSNGLDAIMLLDNGLPTHLGLLVQDDEGKWWHYYWGAEFCWSWLKSFFGVSVKAETWCVEYDGEITLEAINESEQYSGDYEEFTYLNGDFSDCINEMMDETEEYNLYSNNCSQKSLGILSSARNSYSDTLSKTSKK